MCEIEFVIALGNEAGGIDKNKKEALIRSIARDIAGEPRRGHGDARRKGKPEVEMDTEIPNADVKVTEIQGESRVKLVMEKHRE